MSEAMQFCKNCEHVIWEGYGGSASQCKATPTELPPDLVTGPTVEHEYCARVRGLRNGAVGSPTCANYKPKPKPPARRWWQFWR